ncbi:hypothetical protein [Butyrivibrio sp.]|uniref:hypothetical protein n=1 Tax=Butyrivibrio sp. TaxID=28121 RepID=UPI0025C53F70|nr:hypothetical protein [Butyrivibrio sp.]MBE5837586.1 hypothetical protein [Butyrivibrio sp.]
MKKIVRMRKINDITLAFMMLGLAELIFGMAMVVSSALSFSSELFITNIMIDAFIHGSALALNGSLLVFLCIMSTLSAVSRVKVNILFSLSSLSIAIVVIGMIRELCVGEQGFALAFSAIELLICGSVQFVLFTTKRYLGRKSNTESYTWSNEMVLKKVG